MSQNRMLQPVLNPGGVGGVGGGGVVVVGQQSQSQPSDRSGESSLITVNVNGVQVAPLQRVFIQRDYRQGVAIRFMTDFPVELAERIDPNAFEYTIKELNNYFEDAEKFTCGTFCESCVGFFTANLYWLCRDSRYETALKRLSKFIAEQNQCVYLPNGLWITDPVSRGLRCIEISVVGELK